MMGTDNPSRSEQDRLSLSQLARMAPAIFTLLSSWWNSTLPKDMNAKSKFVPHWSGKYQS